ncbi:hypothetical protein E8D34_17855 [Nocardioides sp. GY 10113]|uniref:hypothetical protein n=1 Tax=Nocardioides sp. GY 10113 TaxID=2569761 RepID=UPI0010A8C616|nr:hypothetical protein [Nocardioides sp. GY 10113]TIC81263.1 hypothetical protein E8D34_17855 [Nocardioides sp. GY 10113]
MSTSRSYEYARLWVPLFHPSTLAVTRPVYLIEADDGFEGVVAEKNTTLMAVLNDLGRAGWRIETTPMRVTSPSPEFQLLIDATLDEVDAGLMSGAETGTVREFDVFGMRRRAS